MIRGSLPTCVHILLSMTVNLSSNADVSIYAILFELGPHLPFLLQQPGVLPEHILHYGFIQPSSAPHASPALSLPEPRTTSPHHVPLAHQLGIELAAVQRQVDVKVHPVECALRRVHPLKVLLEVFPRQIGRQCDHLLNSGVFRIFGTMLMLA